MNDRRHLRLVRRPPEPRSGLRVHVRISAIAGSPYGRSRAFRLTEHNIEELLRHAERLESRQ